MNRIIIQIAIQIFLVSNSFGQVVDFNKLANSYLSNLEESATAAFYTACKTQDGKAVLVFSLDGKQGMLFEFKGENVINLSPLVIKGNNISIDITNTQGGIYTFALMENHAKDLLTLNLKFSTSDKIKEIFISSPSNVCIDKPPVP